MEYHTVSPLCFSEHSYGTFECREFALLASIQHNVTSETHHNILRYLNGKRFA